jgi:membrane fusion protein, copper/silver efflux system
MRSALAALWLAACGDPEQPAPDPHAGHDMAADAEPTEVRVLPSAEAALSIRTVPARSGSATAEGRAPAIVRYDPLEVSRITVQAGGEIRRLLLPRPGEPVSRGDLVARIYDPSVAAAFEELLVARGLGEPWLGAARSRLVSMGVLPSSVDRALASGAAPATFSVVSPDSGVVVERTAVEGAWLAPGGLLGSVGDPAAVVADLTVLGPAPGPDEPVVLRDPATGKTWPARVVSRLPTADAAGLQLRVVPEGEVPVGRPLVAEWSLAEVPGVWVPRSAVVDTGTRRVVFVEVGDGRYVPRSVVLGARTADEVQIVDGLAPGTRVVASGTFLLDSETQIGGGMGHAGHGG